MVTGILRGSWNPSEWYAGLETKRLDLDQLSQEHAWLDARMIGPRCASSHMTHRVWAMSMTVDSEKTTQMLLVICVLLGGHSHRKCMGIQLGVDTPTLFCKLTGCTLESVSQPLYFL